MNRDRVFKPRIGLPMYTAGEQPHRWMTSPAYVRAVALAGGIPLPIPLLSDKALLDDYLNTMDGLLFCGGGDIDPAAYGAPAVGLSHGIDPDRDAVELYLARGAATRCLPTLGVCRGLQLMNVAAGGTLVQDIARACPSALAHATPADLPRDTHAHSVAIVSEVASRIPDTLLREAILASPAPPVNSTHHQAVAQVAAPFSVAATAGDGIIEALVGTDGWFRLGVQWHPEEMLNGGYDGLHRALFQALVRAAAQRGEA